MNPGRQAHENSPGRFVQDAFAWQLSIFSVHSLMSKDWNHNQLLGLNLNNMGNSKAIFKLNHFRTWITRSKHVPVQITPFPAYPVLQPQENDPKVFVHMASAWQLCVLMVHSLMSKNTI